MKIRWLIVSASSLLFFIACKQRFYRASSSSMEKTIMTGDRFMVTKTSSFTHNDLVVFDIYSNDYLSPGDEETGQFKKHWEKRIYRLIAFSGDTVQIKEGDVYINGTLIPLPARAMMTYEVISDSIINELTALNELQVKVEREGSKTKYTLPLTNDEVTAYQNKLGPQSIRKIIMRVNENSMLAVPAENLHWSIDNYGPIRIPAPGETVSIDSINYLLFQNIPNIHTGEFKITEPLYFLLGDNRHFAEDSRYTGFISHSKMYGIVK